ncbi:MAG: GNAT family N-acetyltransferase [Thermoproteota archaeon]
MIPEDRWKDLYMTGEELRREIDSGVKFYGWTEGNNQHICLQNCQFTIFQLIRRNIITEGNPQIVGVMDIQPVKDITLTRHAYVLPEHRRRGIGSKLLRHLIRLTENDEILVGT